MESIFNIFRMIKNQTLASLGYTLYNRSGKIHVRAFNKNGRQVCQVKHRKKEIWYPANHRNKPYKLDHKDWKVEKNV
jgi:uncharacterized protein YkuJ